VDLPHDAVAVDFGARLQEGRRSQPRQLLLHLGDAVLRDVVHRHDLHGKVVAAAPAISFRDNGARRLVQAARRIADRGGHEAAIHVLVYAVGGEDEDVASLDLERAVVDLDLRIEADRAAEIALLPRYPDAVVLRELLERAALQPVDARVPDVENMRGGRLEDQAAQRADVAAVLVVAVRALVRARV
jgi:hypothetical protein